MYRNGAFIDLQWNDVKIKHQNRWDFLKEFYHFSNVQLPKSLDYPYGSVQRTRMDILAENCIEQCRELLFSLTPIEFLRDGSIYDDYPDFSWNTRTNMRAELKKALCDHLTMSFAYRFLCENIQPQSLWQSSVGFFDCEHAAKDSEKPEDNDLVLDNKRSFYKTQKEKHRSFCKELGIKSTQGQKGDAEDLDPDSILYKLKESILDKEVADKFGKILQDELEVERIPPPSAWFFLYFISKRIRFCNVFDDRGDGFLALAKLVSEAKWSNILLSKEDTEEPLCELTPILYSTFVGIPFDFKKTADQMSIPEMTFSLKGNKGEATISARLQRGFNNYLFERNFHLFAISTAELYAQKLGMHAERENQRLKTLLLPLKIHASLTQSAFISFFGCMSGLLEETSIVERYVKRWNRCALPALEELFIWSIMEEFSTTEEIVDAIREWSEADSFDERFNIIRLIPTEKIVSVTCNNKTKEAQEFKKFHNAIVYEAFKISDNWET